MRGRRSCPLLLIYFALVMCTRPHSQLPMRSPGGRRRRHQARTGATWACDRPLIFPTPNQLSAVREDAAGDIKRGTRITLHLKPDAMEFADANKLQVSCCDVVETLLLHLKPDALEFAGANKLQVSSRQMGCLETARVGCLETARRLESSAAGNAIFTPLLQPRLWALARTLCYAPTTNTPAVYAATPITQPLIKQYSERISYPVRLLTLGLTDRSLVICTFIPQLQSLIKQYSEFISFPIKLWVSASTPEQVGKCLRVTFMKCLGLFFGDLLAALPRQPAVGQRLHA